MPNKIEIRIGGHGGQGIVLAGQILGRAAAYDRRKVLQTQAYGAEARGSLAKSEVIISDDKISFPAVRKCDVLVAMNQEALDVYIGSLKEDGILLVDSSNVTNVPQTKAKVFKVPATQVAKENFGNAMFANMVMLGALTKVTKIVSEKSMEKSIKETVQQKTVEANLNAFRKGLQT
ncbi:MAG: 2-oxoacid:acceptor oxidoreductase family protein [Candidatus Bathyarchaeia archaeon]